ncbi:cation-translocating P-type ATPase [Candidatus Macondimonas diazotrophica]|uniref:Cation-transporting P-type ATPase n=1 Tax=Candidatus Macondimonas diazotrophica TaxID=2305248 RepID=A0A4Z0F838_9GAMM|nr:cation-transporting P-type ATPase [Candidatus Macondimonas diazotrophica]TFZ82446.1 cation-transporting P-type ATPase [Candidatus Macondimonas diazotrophica]
MPKHRDQATPVDGDAPPVPWHALDARTLSTRLDTPVDGLNEAEVRKRLEQWGPNQLPHARSTPAWRRFARQFNNLLIYVLLISAATTLALQHFIDTSVILAVVLANALIGFIQEGRAEQAIEAIRSLIAPRTTVLREGTRRSIDATAIVPGDLVLLEAGDRVPADLRLLHASRMRIDESLLTGESVAIDKQVDAVPQGAGLGDRLNMAFSGTLVVAGQGLGIVVATGIRTEIGRISTLLRNVQTLKTPLLKKMDRFGRQLAAVILGVSMAVFIGALARGIPWDDAFLVVVGLAVSAIPEGLPAVLSITLALGVRRMAARQAIVRLMPAVETLGAVTVICSDKTGTLTRNEMMVAQIVTAGGDIEVTGDGYQPHGEFLRDGQPVAQTEAQAIRELAEMAVLCNDAELQAHDGLWSVSGDPMEGALVVLAHKAGLDPHTVRANNPRVSEIPFDSVQKFMATVHRLPDGRHLGCVKGAPEQVLDMCAAQGSAADAAPLSRAEWETAIDRLAHAGYRVMAVAARPLTKADCAADEAIQNLTLIGLVGLQDPPRQEALAAVAECQHAGIRVKMITGDHVGTAMAIARQLGLHDGDKALLGTRLEKMDDEALREAVRHTTVFARTTPEHKLRLVQALQANGEVVAMTGDGINDAPALKQADVGVAMGKKGTEAAKEAAEMVLADDNFATIVTAIREGRTVYDNLRKVIAWTLPTNGGESLIFIVAIALGLTLPLSPLQVLWINTITAIGLGLVLAFEPAEPAVMNRPPRRPDSGLLSNYLIWRVILVSVLMAGGTFLAFETALALGRDLETARTLAVNAIVAMEAFYLFNVRFLDTRSLSLQGLKGTPAVLAGLSAIILLQLAFTYTPQARMLFDSRPLAWLDGAAVIGTGLALFTLMELEKLIIGRRFSVHGQSPHEKPHA